MPESGFRRILRMRLFGKSPMNFFLRMNEIIWKNVPVWILGRPLVQAYGRFLHFLVLQMATRTFNFGTLFLRNRPQLELILRLASLKQAESTLKITVLACSKGAEVYSIMWRIRSIRPDLKVKMHAVDISGEVIDFAKRGAYSLTEKEFTVVPVFEGLTENEMEKLFDIEGNRAIIKPWIREGIIWRVGDACDSQMTDGFEPQDIVVANNFLCHMDPSNAEKCLSNISRLVSPGGFLVVSGIDLDVRMKVAQDLGWKPVRDLLEEIHNGDPAVRSDWPLKWWGLEPLNKKRPDWSIRYASVYQVK